MTGELFLGIDIGGTNIKACVFGTDGSMKAKASLPTPVSSPLPGYFERSLEVLREITFDVVRAAAEQLSPAERAMISGIGTTGHGKGLYLLVNAGEDIPAIASTDSRAAELVKEWYANGTAQKATELNLQQTLACQPSALLSWLKRHRRDQYDRIGTVLEAKDYLRYLLTGECFTEYTDASGTGLMNLSTKQYDPELFRLYGIDEMYNCMPPLKEAAELCGRLSAQAAERTGLRAGIAVCGGMFDIDACALAMGVATPEPICVITGTWSINEYLSPEALPKAAGVNHSLFCLPEYYLIEESSATSAGNLDAVLAEIMNDPAPDYKAIDNAVAAVRPEDCDILFYPFMYGTNSAGLKHAAWLNLRLGAGNAAVLRSVFEGVAFSHRYHIDRLLKNRTANTEVLRAGGGAAKSDVWMQMLADVTGIRLEAVTSVEPGAMGAAMAASVCTGAYADYRAAAGRMVTVGRTFVPDPAAHAVYDRKYARYLRALQILEQLDTVI